MCVFWGSRYRYNTASDAMYRGPAILVQEGCDEVLWGGADQLGFGHGGIRGVLGLCSHTPVKWLERLHIQEGAQLRCAHCMLASTSNPHHDGTTRHTLRTVVMRCPKRHAVTQAHRTRA